MRAPRVVSLFLSAGLAVTLGCGSSEGTGGGGSGGSAASAGDGGSAGTGGMGGDAGDGGAGGTGERQWGDAVLIEANNAGSAFVPQVALDPNGNAVAVWCQSVADGTRENIWANRYTIGSGWGTPEMIEDNAGNTGSFHVALDPNGNAVAVWSQVFVMFGDIDVWANRFTPTGGWGAAELIETNASLAFEPQVALDPNGNAVAVWDQSDGTRTNIWANGFTPSGGWGAAERIETDNGGDASQPQVAFDPNGNAVAVWSQSDGTRRDIWANRFE